MTLCSVNQICSRPRSRQTGLPRFQANAAHADGNFLMGAAMQSDLTGLRFGRLKVIRKTGKKNRHIIWECACDCGKSKFVFRTNLVSGDSKSCGCIVIETSRAKAITHGLYKTPTYYSWGSMRSRCKNKNSPNFHNYGGRGIVVCERWNKFENFIADMGLRPSLNHSIDRINNDGNYCSENCQWSTKAQQSNNKRTNVILTFEGKSHTVKQWERIKGFRFGTIANRLRLGWTIESAVSEPISHTHLRNRNQHNGK